MAKKRTFEESAEHFWSKVTPTGFCWLWEGGKTKDGYGQLSFHGKTQTAHKTAYELLIEPVPAGMQLDHLCSIRNCVNPCHLEPVTKRENARRMVERRGWVHGGAKYQPKAPEDRKKRPNITDLTHCKYGHNLIEVGIYVHVSPSGLTVRRCRECKTISRRKPPKGLTFNAQK